MYCKLVENYHQYSTWNSKQPVFIGCFSWMTPDNYMKNGDVTKHPLKTCSLEASKTLEPESQAVFLWMEMVISKHFSMVMI